MHTSVGSSVSAGLIVAVTGAAVLVAPPHVIGPTPKSAEVQLMADPVPVGGLLTSFLGNQLIYCSIICPDVVKLAVTVPVGAVEAPLAFATGLASGNPLKAVGAAVASVTNPLEAAFDPIITNDLNLVLPRAQNALEVGVVGLLNIAAAGPAGLLPAIQTAQRNTFDALNDTIPPSQTAPQPRGLIQVVAVEAINVASSVLFQAFEEGLLGIVQTANAAATTLARTGDPIAAFIAGEKAAFASFGKTIGYIVAATTTAADNIVAALHGSTPSSTVISTRESAVGQQADIAAHRTDKRRPRGAFAEIRDAVRGITKSGGGEKGGDEKSEKRLSTTRGDKRAHREHKGAGVERKASGRHRDGKSSTARAQSQSKSPAPVHIRQREGGHHRSRTNPDRNSSPASP